MTDPSGAAEFAAIERIAARLAAGGVGRPAGELWIGDDAAIVVIGAARVAVSADALVEGVHADLSLTTPADLGWKALAVNVSDLAAMGCVASRAVVTVAGPPDTDLDGLYEGLAAAAETYGCPVVGGDLTGAAVLVVSVTVLGDAGLTPGPVTRAGARPDDQIWVTGPLGGAAAGLAALRRASRGGPAVPGALRQAHARPVPRVAEGTAARELGARAMIDISDGFGADLGHVLDASGVGAELTVVPVATGASAAEALGGGDDYELVFCAPAEAPIRAGFADRGLPEPILVGRCVADRGRRTLADRPFGPSGWAHAIGDPGRGTAAGPGGGR